MNFLKRGPELKLSSLRVPDCLWDLYYDLKERHLLPVAAVLAVALVVLPIALSQSTGSSPSEEKTPIATPSTISGEASSLVVAKSTPGLRDYRQRLREAHALDPFRAQADAAAKAASSAEAAPEPGVISEGSTAPEATGGPAEPVEAPLPSVPPAVVPSESEGSPDRGAGSAGTGTTTGAKYASDTLDVRIVTVPAPEEDAAQSASKPKPVVRRQLPELTMLPNRSAPAAIFMGTSADGKKALLLVSSDVQSLFGDGQCVIGSQTCQLLALEAGVPETFVYGPRARTYRVEVLKIDKKLSNKPRKAPLGKSKGKKKESPATAGRISSAQPK